ncbi:unnamed protein product [Lepeophtheirus salmonis]|uniref:(salmon louse) hypothetical protein n=2 Tax=Lepeophtheirus salmonis TaxID=72036 RepID=A0A7R8HB42_LEPSM|nr:unnamed protein product [Lepeophtheirus salmonis]CAF2979494.1 unnamed protein product [Lepeophtheirus salmonis]
MQTLALAKPTPLSNLLTDIQNTKFSECSAILTSGSSGVHDDDANAFAMKSLYSIYQIQISPSFSNQLEYISKTELKRCRSYIFLLYSKNELLELLQTHVMYFLEMFSFNDKVILVTNRVNIPLVEDISTSNPLFESLLYFVVIGYDLNKGNETSSFFDIYESQFFVDNKRLSFKLIGIWNHQKKPLGSDISAYNLFPRKIQNFYGYDFRISTFHFPPKVSYNKEINYWHGVEIELTRLMAKKLNFQINVVSPEDGKKWGSLENGTYTGLMGDIVNRKADLGFCNLFITRDRLKIIDMTNAYHIDYACFLTPSPKLIPHYMSIIYPFDAQLWACILLTFIILIPFTNFTAGFYTSKINSKKGYFRFFAGGTWAFLLIITWSYKESIKAFLTVPSHEKPINSLEQLVKSDLKWGVRNSGGWPDWFKDSSDPLSQSIYEGFIYVKDNEEGVEKVYTNQYREKELHITSQCFVPFRIGLAMPMSSPYKKAFDKVVLSTIEAGLIELWLRNSNMEAERNNRATHEKNRKSGSVYSNVDAMSLDDFQGVFLIYGIGLGLSIIGFGIEYFKTGKKYQD